MIDVAIPADINVMQKEEERNCNTGIYVETKRIWHVMK